MSGSMQFYLAIAIFVLTYVAIMSEKIPRTICAMFDGGAMLYCGYVTQDEAIKQFIDFNTIGLLCGMMILIAVVKKSGVQRVSKRAARPALSRHRSGCGYD